MFVWIERAVVDEGIECEKQPWLKLEWEALIDKYLFLFVFVQVDMYL